ncbi:hypothetical protein HELRODRAFT_113568, partial [Helobdella robusta]|uniref:Helicase C-terminal domain-containing protein n=1 Tax=Helobdella robusta TaxID=6412 RepID=T1EFT7_HELRO
MSVEDLKKFMKTLSKEMQRYIKGHAVLANKENILKTVAASQVSIIFGNAGMGKTTQIAQYIYEEYKPDRMIVCTQPRKAEAVYVARRVANDMGSSLGQLVGYRVRADWKLNSDTRILFITDHELVNEWFADELFSRYFCIILDEVQERTIYTDLLLWSLKQNLSRRPDLKVIIISTDTDKLQYDYVGYFKNFNPTQLKLIDNIFPVGVIYKAVAVSENHVKHACLKALEFHREEEVVDGAKDILVFLATHSEIEEAIDEIKSKNINNLLPLGLHEHMRAEDIQDVFAPTMNGFRKVVFATNVAQASLTVPEIICVIDSGKERMRNLGTGNKNSYRFQKISSYSAEERRKLAGRNDAGICYRLYSAKDLDSNPSDDMVEVLTDRLNGFILKLMSHGINKFECLEFFKKPPTEPIEESFKSLTAIGAIDNNNQLTKLGKLLAEINLNPKHAEFILEGIKEHLGYESLVISVLSSFEKFQLMKLDKNTKCNMGLHISIFFDNFGDMITWLNIYQDFLYGQKFCRDSWCDYYLVNSKTI